MNSCPHRRSMCVMMTEIQTIEGCQKRCLLSRGDQIKKNHQSVGWEPLAQRIPGPIQEKNISKAHAHNPSLRFKFFSLLLSCCIRVKVVCELGSIQLKASRVNQASQKTDKNQLNHENAYFFIGELIINFQKMQPMHFLKSSQVKFVNVVVFFNQSCTYFYIFVPYLES